jgi:xanthine dehydrogenase small subunit
MLEFILNDKKIKTKKPTGSLLLDLIRYDYGLTGTKIGCREGDCGACTVLIGELINGKMRYKQVNSCLTAIGNVRSKHVVTVEGLNMEELSPVQQTMIAESGTQCGFCTVGFVVSLTGFCLENSEPKYKNAISSIDGNICRCTGYKSIERAAQHITKSLAGKNQSETVDWLVENKFIPSYFKTIPDKLNELSPVEETHSGKILVGGGSDLYVQNPDILIDRDVDFISNYPEFRLIRIKNGICTLGGANTVSDLMESEELLALFPRLSEFLRLLASSPIRNISTLAGNLVNASPIGDLTIFFLALDTKITLTGQGRERTIYLKDFYKAYKELDKTGEEMVSRISFEVPTANFHFNFEKVSKRIHLDIASVNTAAQFLVSDKMISTARISAGGVSPIPIFLKKTSAFLQGKKIAAETIKAANEVLQSEISPISDVRGKAGYKRLLLRQLFYAHFIKLFPKQISLEGLI